MGDMDREGIGMLYATGAGITVGASLAWGLDPIFGWLGGSTVVALGFAYEIFQRSVHAGTDRSEGEP